MTGQLEGKVVAITGAGSGIGRATAAVAAAQGARLVLGDRDQEALNSALQELTAAPGTAAEGVELDVADPESVERFVGVASTRFGRLDGLVNSAGITTVSPAIDMSLADWNRVIGVNLTGAFLVAQQAARAMLTSGARGSIVHLTSALAVAGQRNGAHYAASKAGVIALTKTMALELGPQGIRVNAVAPGATESPLLRRTVSSEFLEEWIARNPMGRLGQPHDHANMIGFLLSDATEWITGQTFHVNGGSIMP